MNGGTTLAFVFVPMMVVLLFIDIPRLKQGKVASFKDIESIYHLPLISAIRHLQYFLQLRKLVNKKAELTLTGGKCAIPANQLKLARKFAAFMEENKKLIDLCETGKGNLQWERDIPPAALKNLEDLAKGDFKANLGKIIHDIYQTAHVMFSDMPQGDHKKRAKYR